MASEREIGRVDFVVRCVEPHDRATLMRWYGKSEIQSALEDEPLSFWDRRWKVGQLIASDPYEDEQGAFIFELDSHPVGLVHFMWINWISRTAEIDFLLAPGEKHPPLRGLMLLQRVARIAFCDLNLHKLYACVYARNRNSLKLLGRLMRMEVHLKNYLKCDGHYEDAYLAGITFEDYLSLPARVRG